MPTKPTYSKGYTAPRRGLGFAAMSGLIQTRVKTAGEKRGFAVMRLLTHWQEIVGEDTAKMTTPVKVGYSRDGFGAVLTVLTTGSNAPLVQMQLPQIRDRVNGCYGYSAISRVVVTQTAPVGFHEGRTAFEAVQEKPKAPVSAEVKKTSAKLAGDAQALIAKTIPTEPYKESLLIDKLQLNTGRDHLRPRFQVHRRYALALGIVAQDTAGFAGSARA